MKLAMTDAKNLQSKADFNSDHAKLNAEIENFKLKTVNSENCESDGVWGALKHGKKELSFKYGDMSCVDNLSRGYFIQCIQCESSINCGQNYAKHLHFMSNDYYFSKENCKV